MVPSFPRARRGISRHVTSLWLDARAEQPWSANRIDDGPLSADVVVVGAGITGLMTGVLLTRAGKNVLVLEARTVGACATGNTTAKISLLQGSHMSKLLSKHGKDTAVAYLEGGREGPLRHVGDAKDLRTERRQRPPRRLGFHAGSDPRSR